MQIRLIKSKAELSGTCYFELLPGPYRDICWNSESVYLKEAVFGIVEAIFKTNVEGYDHYAFMEIGKAEWACILSDLQSFRLFFDTPFDVAELSERLRFFFFEHPEDAFFAEFHRNVADIVTLLDDLIEWLSTCLNDHDVISVLGM